jgi:hypothetical protein
MLLALRVSTLLSLISALFITSCSSVTGAPDAEVGKMPSSGPVGKTMRANSEKFAACARDSVTIQTGTVQNVQLRFQIDAQGIVKKAKVDSMTLGDPDLHSCVLRTLYKIRFPKPGDGKQKDILYPLSLRSN